MNSPSTLPPGVPGTGGREIYWLQGDEDGGVDLKCRLCPPDGRCVVNYGPFGPTRTDYPHTDTIGGLVLAAVQHFGDEHALPLVEGFLRQ